MVALLAWCFPDVTNAFEWRRDEPWQLWRAVTGHFCHWSVDHLCWDLVVFATLGALVERCSRRVFIACVALAAVAITVGLAILCPHLDTYRGLSGLDCALLGGLVGQLLVKARAERNGRAALIASLIVTVFAVKLGIEIAGERTLFVDSASAFVPVPLAHAIGFVVGSVAACVLTRSQQCRHKARFEEVERVTFGCIHAWHLFDQSTRHRGGPVPDAHGARR